MSLDVSKEILMGTTTEEAAVAASSTGKPLAASAKIQWASAPVTPSSDLEAQFEAMRSRNWITDRMVEQYQKHWHCSREAALERLLAKTGT